ncbi:hypothetical protein [Zhihengliuella sp.]|uniref:hypothetical protein n=1 Tax=Zhihengliuella sp. TaxID=1954483 RepID=UPI002811EA61|nr:hypothetical protein [Zhihengliuella sp.]
MTRRTRTAARHAAAGARHARQDPGAAVPAGLADPFHADPDRVPWLGTRREPDDDLHPATTGITLLTSFVTSEAKLRRKRLIVKTLLVAGVVSVPLVAFALYLVS